MQKHGGARLVYPVKAYSHCQTAFKHVPLYWELLPFHSYHKYSHCCCCCSHWQCPLRLWVNTVGQIKISLNCNSAFNWNTTTLSHLQMHCSGATPRPRPRQLSFSSWASKKQLKWFTTCTITIKIHLKIFSIKAAGILACI